MTRVSPQTQPSSSVDRISIPSYKKEILITLIALACITSIILGGVWLNKTIIPFEASVSMIAGGGVILLVALALFYTSKQKKKEAPPSAQPKPPEESIFKNRLTNYTYLETFRLLDIANGRSFFEYFDLTRNQRAIKIKDDTLFGGLGSYYFDDAGHPTGCLGFHRQELTTLTYDQFKNYLSQNGFAYFRP